MNVAIVVLLAAIQGLTELLPVSSSAHVILAERLLGLEPTAPAMTFLLVMLHTGTMFAVLLYFWKRWRWLVSAQNPHRRSFFVMLVLATAVTGVVGLGLQLLIEKVYLRGVRGAAVEELFGNLWLIALSLALVGSLIFFSGRRSRGARAETQPSANHRLSSSVGLGLVQGLSLPFRGFSRSGATISFGLLAGMSRAFAEEFSFGLSLILTLPVVAREALRLKNSLGASGVSGDQLWLTGLLGMVGVVWTVLPLPGGAHLRSEMILRTVIP